MNGQQNLARYYILIVILALLAFWGCSNEILSIAVDDGFTITRPIP